MICILVFFLVKTCQACEHHRYNEDQGINISQYSIVHEEEAVEAASTTGIVGIYSRQSHITRQLTGLQPVRTAPTLR